MKDAQQYYKNLTTHKRKSYAEIKAQEAREALKDKLGLSEVNRYERNQREPRSHNE